MAILGPPGSGKGTQSARLATLLGAGHISTGDALRREARIGSPIGRKATRYLAEGCLAPDDLVIDALKAELERQRGVPGVLLDGFPRTIAQAEAFDHLSINSERLVVTLVVPRVLLRRRLSGRGRPDDRPDIAWRRVISYQKETRPLLARYAARGLLVHVDGSPGPAEVTATILRCLRGTAVATG